MPFLKHIIASIILLHKIPDEIRHDLLGVGGIHDKSRHPIHDVSGEGFGGHSYFSVLLVSLNMSSTRIKETLACADYIQRVLELESQGASYWVIKVLPHASGYEIQCDVPQNGISSDSPELPLG